MVFQPFSNPHSVDVAKIPREFKIKVKNLEKDDIEFDMIGIDASIAYAFRRSLIAEIEEYYSAQGLGIVGYVHANERFDDLELSNVAKNIENHIHRYFQQAFLLLIYSKGDSSKSWKVGGTDSSNRLSLKEPSANIVLLDYISSQNGNK